MELLLSVVYNRAVQSFANNRVFGSSTQKLATHLRFCLGDAKYFQINACMFSRIGESFVPLDQIVCVKVRLIFGEKISPFRFPDSRELSVAGIRSTNP